MARVSSANPTPRWEGSTKIKEEALTAMKRSARRKSGVLSVTTERAHSVTNKFDNNHRQASMSQAISQKYNKTPKTVKNLKTDHLLLVSLHNNQVHPFKTGETVLPQQTTTERKY